MNFPSIWHFFDWASFQFSGFFLFFLKDAVTVIHWTITTPLNVNFDGYALNVYALSLTRCERADATDSSFFTERVCQGLLLRTNIALPATFSYANVYHATKYGPLTGFKSRASSVNAKG